jgi:hypothetical protein
MFADLLHLFYASLPAVWFKNTWAVGFLDAGLKLKACIVGKWELWLSSARVVDDAACGSTLVGIFPLLGGLCRRRLNLEGVEE